MSELCPVCLLATALSSEDEPWGYQVLAPIGASASGVTYLAQPPNQGRAYVALKVLNGRRDVDAVRDRFERWISTRERLQHPSIGKLIDVGMTPQGTLYVATEHVVGWPVTGWRSHPSFGVNDRRVLGRQLTEALEAAHAAGLVHLRLRSSKVKVSTTNGVRAVILGFGYATVVDGEDGDPEIDRASLARIAGDLDILL